MTDTVSALLLFGATGDLSQRMLLPSLYGLHADGLLADDLRIIGTARSDLSDAAFHEFGDKALRKNVPAERVEDEKIASFLKRLTFVAADISDPESFGKLAEAVGPAKDTGLAIYLSTAPQLFETAIKGLEGAGLAGPKSRLALEKPLGSDLASSREINDAVLLGFPEERTFRIDHYLGKETVQNLIALRFGNALFEPMWNARGIDYVQITVGETVGLENRAGYYDGSGALRDMVANHILQLLALVAMEVPSHFDATAIRNEKVKVLNSLRAIDERTARDNTIVGQYTAGVSAGGSVPGYIDELGKPSNTETFVAIKAHVDNWRWQGVPFYLRTGKRLPVRTSEIVIQFKGVPHSIFTDRGGRLHRNRLVIKLQPEELIRLLVMAKVPGLDRDGIHLKEVPLDLSLDTQFKGTRRRIAYERLLLDLIEGDPTLFVRRDEIEAQWRWIDGIRAGWAANDMEPKPYPAGSWGPSAAIALTERDGVHWND